MRRSDVVEIKIQKLIHYFNKLHWLINSMSIQLRMNIHCLKTTDEYLSKHECFLSGARKFEEADTEHFQPA